MALQKQLVPLVIEQGLNTKTDIKQEEPGYLRQAQNVVYETIHKLKKRNGYNNIDLYDLNGDEITGARYVTKLKSELVLLTDRKLYAYSQSLGRFAEKGGTYHVRLRSNVVVKNALDQEQCDALAVDQFKVYAWADSAGNVRYSVQDAQDGSYLVADALVAVGDAVALGRIQNVVYIIYGAGTALRFKSFSILQPSTLSGVTTVANDRDGLIDARSVGTKVMVSYNSSTNLKLFSINDGGDTSSILGLTSQNATHALDVHTDSALRVILTWSDGSDLKYAVYPYTLAAALLGTTVIDTTNDITSCCAISESTAGTYRFYYEVNQSAAGTNYVKTATGTISGTVAGAAVYMRSVGLGARAFRYDDQTYVVLVHDSSLQATYFVCDADGALVTKFANQTASGVNEYGMLPEVSFLSSTEAFTAALFRNRLSGSNGTFFSTNGVMEARINFAPPTNFSSAVLSESLHVAAGCMKVYDGASVSEDGFHVFPENIVASADTIDVTVATTQVGVVGVTAEIQTITPQYSPGSGSFTLTYSGETTAAIAWNANAATIKSTIEALTYITSTVTVTGTIAAGLTVEYNNSMGDVVQPTVTSSLKQPLTGGAMSDGNYAYVAVYRWTDNTGRDHRSAPTLVPYEVVVAGGGATQQVAVDIATLRITEKQNVAIELYRTENNGTEYYKVTSDTSPLLNDKTVDSVTFYDTLSDASLISREALYTTGGVLENIGPGAVHQVCTLNGERLAYLDEERSRVRFSKVLTEGGPVEYYDGAYRDVDPSAGELTAIGAMEGKLILFSADGSYYITGEGPNNLGLNDSFTKPDVLSTDVGCTEPDSLKLTPLGLMFKSRKGIWSFGPQGMQYIGDRVEAYNDQTVTSAAVVGELNQVRFTLSSQRTLVFNYNLNRWATFENHGGLSSVAIDSDYFYLREDGSLYKENSDSFSDASSPIRFKIETGWLSLVELQGVQRAYHAMLLGDFKSSHKLRVRVAYNFIDAWVQEALIDPQNFADLTTYGEDSPYGEGTPYGGDGSLYQMRVNFKKQKCQSIKLSIEDVQDSVGEGMSLSAITLRVGAKEGTGKIGASRTFGSE